MTTSSNTPENSPSTTGAQANHYLWAWYWAETWTDCAEGCWLWTADGSDARPGRGRYWYDAREWPANFIPWVAVVGTGLRNAVPNCGSLNCVRPDHQAVLLAPGWDREEVDRRVQHLVRCPNGHAYAGGNYVVVDRMTEGIYRGECRLCWAQR